MMRRALGLALAIAAAATPVAAQEAPQYGANDDVDCVLVISLTMAGMTTEGTAKQREGLASAMTYFIGRYEAVSTRPLADAMAERYPFIQGEAFAPAQQVCSVRMKAMAARMREAGAALRILGGGAEQQPAEAPSGKP